MNLCVYPCMCIVHVCVKVEVFSEGLLSTSSFTCTDGFTACFCWSHYTKIMRLGSVSTLSVYKHSLLTYLQEGLYSELVEIDRRVHSRIIGGQGRGVRRITEKFNVDLRFPGRDADNPDLVVITGVEDAVLDCRDHLLQLEDEFVSNSAEKAVIRAFRRF